MDGKLILTNRNTNRKNMKYNTIIIGGGLAGLTAGATLAKLGQESPSLRATL